MIEFLITLFESLGLYSVQNGLAEHLRGLDMACSDYTRQSIYNIIFTCLLAINAIVVINYYYGIFNRRPFNRWWWWLINAGFTALVLFFIAFLYSYNDFSTNNFCKNLEITSSDCYGFGFTAAIYSFLLFIILSLIVKWGSSINKKVPF